MRESGGWLFAAERFFSVDENPLEKAGDQRGRDHEKIGSLEGASGVRREDPAGSAGSAAGNMWLPEHD